MSKKIEFTYEECLEIAKKYSKRSEFKEKNRTCFNYSKKMGWYDKITKHILTKSPRKRTYDEVSEAAKQYTTRMEFKNNDIANYCFAVTHGWIDKVCSHMRPVGDKYKRCVYVYEFPNKVCYVGLTYDIASRHWEHLNKKCFSSVRRYCEKNNIEIPTPKQLSDYIDSYKAAVLEGKILEEYRNNGWKCLNVAKTGGLGGKKHDYKDVLITIGLCKEKAMECETPSEFQIKHRNLYKISKQREWIDYIFSHFDFENIRLNKNRKISEKNKGKKTSKKAIEKLKLKAVDNGKSKAVLQFDLEGNFICEFLSQSDAAKSLGHPKSHSDIGKCCNGILKTCLGCVWKYKNNISKLSLR